LRKYSPKALTSPFDKDMNFIDLLLPTKGQCVQYLPRKILAEHQKRKKQARVLGILAMDSSSLCE